MAFERSPLPLPKETVAIINVVNVMGADLERAEQQIADLEKALAVVTAERDALRAAERAQNGHARAEAEALAAQ